mmetsp:Transcript_22216/g.56445  ORF Transcript_22216/g.56445 Transcript_22216/m.56445 type:complete len:260 (-) Transcript_22216:685-1464(-)
MGLPPPAAMLQGVSPLSPSDPTEPREQLRLQASKGLVAPALSSLCSIACMLLSWDATAASAMTSEVLMRGADAERCICMRGSKPVREALANRLWGPRLEPLTCLSGLRTMHSTPASCSASSTHDAAGIAVAGAAHAGMAGRGTSCGLVGAAWVITGVGSAAIIGCSCSTTTSITASSSSSSSSTSPNRQLHTVAAMRLPASFRKPGSIQGSCSSASAASDAAVTLLVDLLCCMVACTGAAFGACAGGAGAGADALMGAG